MRAYARPLSADLTRTESAGRMGGVSDTARLAWFWSGLGVVPGLGPGLTRESADAAPGCLSNDPSAGSQVRATAGAAGRSARPGQEAGVHGSGRPAGACHPL